MKQRAGRGFAFLFGAKDARIRTMKAVALILLVLTLTTLADGQDVPKFSRYKVAVEKSRIAKIDFKKNPHARTYRTRLSEALRGGVNFAGRYVIAGWGCGTGCTNAAVIDTRTGTIHWPEEFSNVDASYGDSYSDIQLDFKKNCRLLIIHGRPGTANESGPSGPTGDYYFEWRGDRFRQLKVVPKE
jgi:hypothetical protein